MLSPNRRAYPRLAQVVLSVVIGLTMIMAFIVAGGVGSSTATAHAAMLQPSPLAGSTSASNTSVSNTLVTTTTSVIDSSSIVDIVTSSTGSNPSTTTSTTSLISDTSLAEVIVPVSGTTVTSTLATIVTNANSQASQNNQASQTIVYSGTDFRCTEVGSDETTLLCYIFNSDGTVTGASTAESTAAHASEVASHVHRVGATRAF